MLRVLIFSLTLVLVFPPMILYLTLLERKVLADMQGRLGPMRVGPHGLLQGLADAFKLLLKEDIVPASADPVVFRFAPVFSTAAALAALAIVPLGRGLELADLNAGLLIVLALGSVGVLGLVLGGWASNSHYSLLGALRAAAQLISYEVAMAFAILSAVLSAGTLRLGGIIMSQLSRRAWFAFDHFGFGMIAFGVFLVAALAEGNRAPFDLPEAESELSGGYHLEYSGMRFAFFMLSEYANLFVACAIGVTLFWGGWLRPFPNVRWLDVPIGLVAPALVCFALALIAARLARRAHPSLDRAALGALSAMGVVAGGAMLVPTINAALAPTFWFLVKVFALVYLAIWLRATLPRMRYDQLMRLGWKYLIPAGIAALAGNALIGIAAGSAG